MSEGTVSGTWPQRLPIMAGVGALGGLAVDLISPDFSPDADVLRISATVALFAAVLAFLMVAERVRLGWSALFAGALGLILGGIAWSTGLAAIDGDVFPFPFISAILAVLIAAPLFQSMRDAGRAEVGTKAFHVYAWSDAIIGAASLAFTGLTFLLFALMSILFDAIGIDWLKELLNQSWFAWMLAGAAFGAASARLRDSEGLLGTLQRLIAMIVSVLAPVLAIALLLFLVAVPLTGFAGLWKSGLPETPLLLSIAAFSVVFLNALIGDERGDRRDGGIWRWTEMVLAGAILPLGLLAVVSMGMRIGQYGLTPERIWGVIAAGVALVWGAAAAWSLYRGRGGFDEPYRAMQVKLAYGLVALGLFLALPILDFGAWSARSQLARLEAGKVSTEEFDWAALAYDFGPAGRKALEEIKSGSDKPRAALAARALAVEDRWELREESRIAERMPEVDANVRLIGDVQLDDPIRRVLASNGSCERDVQCVLMRDGDRLLLVKKYGNGPRPVSVEVLDGERLAQAGPMAARVMPPPVPSDADLDDATLEVRSVELRQVYVNGKPAGAPFE